MTATKTKRRPAKGRPVWSGPPELKRLLVPIDAVRPLERNRRRGDVESVMASLTHHGQYKPIVARRETNEVLVGNHTTQGARELGWTHIAVLWRSEPDDDEAERLAIVDNRTSDLAEWDVLGLSQDVARLSDAGGLAGTGFSEVDLKGLLKEATAIAASDAASKLAQLREGADVAPPARPVTRPGDLIGLGDHLLICGDSTERATVDALMDAAGAETLDLIFTSPPYNVDVRYGGQQGDTLDFDAYLAFCTTVATTWVARLGAGRLIGWNIGVTDKTRPYRHAVMLEDLGLTFDRQLVWRKLGVPLPTWYHSRDDPHVRRFSPNITHELIYLFSRGARPKQGPKLDAVDNVASNDVFEVAQFNAGAGAPPIPAGDTKTGSAAGTTLDTRAMKAHPAAFPVALAGIYVRHLAAPGEIVADPFAGAGSTLLAAEQLGRRSVNAEIEPAYCDVIVTRWEQMTGKTADRPKRRRRTTKETT